LKLLQRKIFLDAEWTVLPPVGGITIFENLQMDLHPMRLQIESEVGSKLLDYVWPARNQRNPGQPLYADDDGSYTDPSEVWTKGSTEGSMAGERSLAKSRSHANLRDQNRPSAYKFRSSTTNLNELADTKPEDERTALLVRPRRHLKEHDASTMRLRSSAKTFVRVIVPKVHVLLSAKVRK
jgi:hypothetical protein